MHYELLEAPKVFVEFVFVGGERDAISLDILHGFNSEVISVLAENASHVETRVVAQGQE